MCVYVRLRPSPSPAQLSLPVVTSTQFQTILTDVTATLSSDTSAGKPLDLVNIAVVFAKHGMTPTSHPSPPEGHTGKFTSSSVALTTLCAVTKARLALFTPGNAAGMAWALARCRVTGAEAEVLQAVIAHACSQLGLLRCQDLSQLITAVQSSGAQRQVDVRATLDELAPACVTNAARFSAVELGQVMGALVKGGHASLVTYDVLAAAAAKRMPDMGANTLISVAWPASRVLTKVRCS